MKLYYWGDDNFGDALNPIIFNYYLPKIFDQDTDEIFIGIGSILGTHKTYSNTVKKYVFSTGYAYGEIPQIDKSYKVLCVRGPLTAETCNLNTDLAVADGAILLSNIFKDKYKKEYKYSFMPHHNSEGIYDWRQVTRKLSINYISPLSEVDKIIEEIKKTEFLITEAMHGAIVADTYRIPWVPVRCYDHINKFKWKDYCKSMGIKYNPVEIPRLFNNEMMNKLINKKIGLSDIYLIPQKITNISKYFIKKREEKALKMLENIKNTHFVLSSETILNKKKEILESLLDEFRNENT